MNAPPPAVEDGQPLSPMRWRPGDSVAFGDIRNGVVYFAWPLRVFDVTPGRLLAAQRPGAMGRVPKGYPSDPESVLAQLTSVEPELVDLAWERTITLSVIDEAAVWIPRLFWDAGSKVFLGYYVDFVRPVVFGSHSVDTSDLELDVLVAPGGGWRYKDEENYLRLRRSGWITDADHASVEAAKEEVARAIESKLFPFDGSLVDWRWPDGLERAALLAW